MTICINMTLNEKDLLKLIYKAIKKQKNFLEIFIVI